MVFVGRWFAALAVAFLSYPMAFVAWHGPDAHFGYAGAILLMMFLQFISPFKLWLIPLAAGTAAALIWQAFAKIVARQRRDDGGVI